MLVICVCVDMNVLHVCMCACVSEAALSKQNRTEARAHVVKNLSCYRIVPQLKPWGKHTAFAWTLTRETVRATRGNVRLRSRKALKPRDHQVTCSSRGNEAKILVPDLSLLHFRHRQWSGMHREWEKVSCVVNTWQMAYNSAELSQAWR